MERREFVRLLVAAAASRVALAQQASHKPPLSGAPAPGPTPWTLGIGQLESVRVPETAPGSVAAFQPAFFNPAQIATLRRLCAVLLPPIGARPGALNAGTPEFLDMFIGESDDDSKKLYRQGLDWLDTGARKTCGVAFAAATDDQAGQIIRPWLRTWMTDHLPTEPRAHFINAVHADIRLATMNSPAWASFLSREGKSPPEELYWLPVQPDIFEFHIKQ